MKKIYKKPEIEVSIFLAEDIIRTSGGLSDSLKSKGVDNIQTMDVGSILKVVSE